MHWCDICKNFKPHYLQLATRVQELAAQTQNATVAVHAVSCAPNRPLCRAQSVDRYPVIRVYGPGDTVGVEVPSSQVNPVKVLEKLGMDVTDAADDGDWDDLLDGGDHGNSGKAASLSSWLDWLRTGVDRWRNPQSPWADKFARKRSRDDLRDDVHLSFDYAMRQGVFMTNDPISDERAQVLYEWFLLLRKTLPPSWKALHNAIEDLVVNFDYVRRNEGYLIAYLEANPPPRSVWSAACSRGDPDAGYSCGLWTMFHAVTVGFVDHNQATAFAENLLVPETVARSIRDYVDHFFGCAGCRRNFITAYDLCAHDRCQRLLQEKAGQWADWVQLPLWLLETHNSVNRRLMQEQAARENNWVVSRQDEVAVTWPPAADCPRCWSSGGDNVIKQPNHDMLYKYLKLEYGQRDAQASEYKKEIFSLAINVEENETDTGTGESTTSTSIDLWAPARKLADAVWEYLSDLQSLRRTLTDVEADVHFSFDYAMRHEVFQTDDEPLPDEEADMLWRWLHLLRRTLPSSWRPMQSLITELLDNFDYVAKSADYLRAMLDEFPLDRGSGSSVRQKRRGACKRQHKKNPFDQYTCGMWELFHVVSVGLIHHNALVAASDDERFYPKDVAGTIRDYTTYFFDQSRFSTQIDLCGDGSCDKLLAGAGTVTDWMDLPLWLFERHNAANVQLVKERAARANREPTSKEIIEARWPAISECQDCWLVAGKWRFSSEKVYKYLLLEYGPHNVLTRGLREELGIVPEVDFATRIQEFTEQSWMAQLLCSVFCRENCGRRTQKELEADVSLAFDFMMRQGVFTTKADRLSDYRQQVLKDWLELLQKTLPDSWNSIHSLLKELLDNYSYVAKSKPYLDALLDEYSVDQTQWSATCSPKDGSGTESSACGMWTMLHVVSIGSVKYNRKVDHLDVLSTGSVAITIRDAVDKFFDCHVCRDFFAHSFDNCEYGRCESLSMKLGEESDWVQLPLWLSRLHNSVNLQQMKVEAAKGHRVLNADDESTASWPVRTECNCCWNDDGEPNEEVTYRYLEYIYGWDDSAVAKVGDEL